MSGWRLDGDADRLGVVDENGVYLSTLEVFSLIADHLMGRKRRRRRRGLHDNNEFNGRPAGREVRGAHLQDPGRIQVRRPRDGRQRLRGGR